MNVAYIPVRGGSKSIPLKNIKKLNGKPLVYWVIEAAANAKSIDKIYVATDSNVIRECVLDLDIANLEVIGRSTYSAVDTASTETAMLEFANEIYFDNIVLIQATSPLLRGEDLEKGFKVYAQEGTDSVLSVVRQKRFIWENSENGFSIPVNYNPLFRPRRQEFNGFFVENGAFYITSRKLLLATKSRISGNVRMVEMDEKSYFELDEPSDWEIVEKLLQGYNKNNNSFNGKNIKMFLTDCDGCLTDGGMYYTENGDEIKKFNAKDGMGFQLLRENGIIVGIITGESRNLLQNRSEKLKVDILEMGVTDKLSIIKKLCDSFQISLKNVAYVGDDINDIEVIRNVGFGCAVKNAGDEIKLSADYITQHKGGDGAVREVIDCILRSMKNSDTIRADKEGI